MANASGPGNADDPHDLNRFLWAQREDYKSALVELENGQKTLTLDVVHLPAIRWAWVQCNLQALRDQGRRRSRGIPEPFRSRAAADRVCRRYSSCRGTVRV